MPGPRSHRANSFFMDSEYVPEAEMELPSQEHASRDEAMEMVDTTATLDINAGEGDSSAHATVETTATGASHTADIETINAAVDRGQKSTKKTARGGRGKKKQAKEASSIKPLQVRKSIPPKRGRKFAGPMKIAEASLTFDTDLPLPQSPPELAASPPFYTIVNNDWTMQPPRVDLLAPSFDIRLQSANAYDYDKILAFLKDEKNTESHRSMAKMSTQAVENLARKWTSPSGGGDPSTVEHLIFVVTTYDLFESYQSGCILGLVGFESFAPLDGSEPREKMRNGIAAVWMGEGEHAEGYAAGAITTIIDFGLKHLGLMGARLRATRGNSAIIEALAAQFGSRMSYVEHDDGDEYHIAR